MASARRRFTIGAAGPLTRDESLGGGRDDRGETRTYGRGEVRPFSAPEPRDIPGPPEIVVIVPDEQFPIPPDSGGDGGVSPGDEGEGPGAEGDAGGPGGGDTSGGGDGSGTGDFKRGGRVPDKSGAKGGAEPVVAHQGEWIINRAASRKYGDAFMKALNAGQVRMVKASQYAKGGKVDFAASGNKRARY